MRATVCVGTVSVVVMELLSTSGVVLGILSTLSAVAVMGIVGTLSVVVVIGILSTLSVVVVIGILSTLSIVVVIRILSTLSIVVGNVGVVMEILGTLSLVVGNVGEVMWICVNDVWCGAVVGSVVVGNVVALVNLVTLLEVGGWRLEVGSVNGVWRRKVVVEKLLEIGSVNGVWRRSVVVGNVIGT